MLWWLIGGWLASGTVLPVCVAYRWLAASKIGPKGLHVLSGLVVGIGALVLWFVCSFRDSSIAMRDTPLASAVAQAPMTHAEVAEAGPIQLLASDTLPPSPAQFSAKPVEADIHIEAGAARRGLLARLGEADASIQPAIGVFGQSTGDDASHQNDAAVPQALLTAPLHAKLGMKRDLAHRDARGPSVGPYITRSSSSGLWLFAPNSNEGANN